LHRPCREVGAALREHVAIAAGIFLPAPAAFRHDHRIDDAVEKIAVVADQDHGALIVAQHFFEHVERFEIEIVRRLVEHQQVRRSRQCAGEHQAAAFAARQNAKRRPCLFGREQEIAHIADDVFCLRADRNRVAAAAGERLA
jgi:hypothetical protein